MSELFWLFPRASRSGDEWHHCARLVRVKGSVNDFQDEMTQVEGALEEDWGAVPEV